MVAGLHVDVTSYLPHTEGFLNLPLFTGHSSHRLVLRTSAQKKAAAMQKKAALEWVSTKRPWVSTLHESLGRGRGAPNTMCLLNEFAMHWALRTRFPLHFVIFKQTASHLPHTRPMWSASFRALVISRL